MIIIVRATSLAILLVLAALLLAGCGGIPAEPAPTPAGQTEEIADTTSEPLLADADSTSALESLLATKEEDEIAMITADALAVRMRGADSNAVYLLAANVGKGDALILRVGSYIGLIDTGKTRVMGRVRRAMAAMGADFPEGGHGLDGVFITHTDDDHTGGLEWLAKLPVENWYASAMYTGVKEGKHPVAQAAEGLGQSVTWLRRGDAISLGDTGATLRVLAPVSLYKDKDDNNSLVMMLESDQGRMLFTGDMELPEEAELLSYGDDLSCAVLKVANHGDDDTTSAAFAGAAAAQVALISTDSQEKPGTPDPGVVNRLRMAGSRVVVTQDSALGVLVTLKDGAARVEYVDFGEATVSDVYIAEVDATDDRVVLGNSGESSVDLNGCYLYSDRGDELFTFPKGAVIQPDGALTVGTNSTDGSYDVLWDDKKVVNKKKTDVIYLYDSWGRLVDSRDNGK